MSPRTTDRSRKELRNDLLDATNNLLQEDGLEGFSLTRAAENADTSKQMIYTLFGSKADLIKAVYDHKIDGFAEHLAETEGDDPVHTLLKYALAYRDWILKNESMFNLLFSLELHQRFEEREDDVLERNVLFDYYDEQVREAIDQGIIDESVDVESLSESFWAAANGSLRLEVLDYYEDEETAKEHYVNTVSGVFWGCGTVLPEMDEAN